MEVSGQLYSLAAVPVGKDLLVQIECEPGWAPEPVTGDTKRENMYSTQDGKRADHVTKCLKENRYVQKGCL